jgi:L-idonate 5-dehydrogenase
MQGKRVLVSASGALVSGSDAIGLLTASTALAAGAAEVVTTDLLPGPLRRARDLGAHSTVRIGAGELASQYFDVVFECTAVPVAISAALEAARRGGTVVLVGIHADEARPVNLAPLSKPWL